MNGMPPRSLPAGSDNPLTDRGENPGRSRMHDGWLCQPHPFKSDLAAEVGALLIVSTDTDLLSMSPWRGTPVIEPAAFAAKVDAMRRHAGRRHR